MPNFYNTQLPPSSSQTAIPRYVSDEEKQEHAYQYYGYPAFTELMASSSDFFILRRFAPLAARSLLYLQNEIAAREKKVRRWDDESRKVPSGQGGCGSFEKDRDTPREKLIIEIIPLLEQYYSLLNQFSQVKSRRTATAHQIQSLNNWKGSFPSAIDEPEQHLFNEENVGDLFPLVSKQKTPLTSILESLRLLRFGFSFRKGRPDRIQSQYVRYYSETGFEIFTSIVIVFLGLGLLFGPVWWLNFVWNDIHRLLIITGFVTLFAIWLGLAAGPRSFEILAGTAAYAAVLMVYLQVQKGNK